MVYKTWSYHFSKNWHFYAIIAVLAVGVAYLSQRVYRLNKEIANKKANRRRRDETRDHYSRDYDVEAAGETARSEFTDAGENNEEIIDDGEPLEIVTEKLKDEKFAEQNNTSNKTDSIDSTEKKSADTNLNDDDFENIPDEVGEGVPEETPVKNSAPTYPICKTIIKSGKRKGEECGKPAMNGVSTCRFHS